MITRTRCLIIVFLIALVVTSCVNGDGGGNKETSAYDRCWKSCVFEAERWTGVPCPTGKVCGYDEALEELNEAEWRGYKAMVKNAKEMTCPKQCSK